VKLIRRVLAWMKPTDPNLQPVKGGRNDLRRWRAFGGTLERPAAPARMTR
jgi:hypothetical protein